MNFMLNYHRISIRHVLVLVAALIQVTVPSAQAAEKVAAKNAPTGDEKIQITADQLLSSSQDNYAEFIGNVEVHRGAFVIKSDRLRIYYKNLKGRSKNPAMGEESIEKIIALGHVKIWSDDRVAETDRAEWSMTDRIIVLSGENSKVTSGDNFITGSKITLYQVDGRIKVEGHNGQRVKATFYQGKKETTKGVEEKP
jgi:lipopolysaccharide export system protein LptA